MSDDEDNVIAFAFTGEELAGLLEVVRNARADAAPTLIKPHSKSDGIDRESQTLIPHVAVKATTDGESHVFRFEVRW